MQKLPNQKKAFLQKLPMKMNIFHKKRKIISCFLRKMTKNEKIEYYYCLFQVNKSKKGDFNPPSDFCAKG